VKTGVQSKRGLILFLALLMMGSKGIAAESDPECPDLHGVFHCFVSDPDDQDFIMITISQSSDRDFRTLYDFGQGPLTVGGGNNTIVIDGDRVAYRVSCLDDGNAIEIYASNYSETLYRRIALREDNRIDVITENSSGEEHLICADSETLFKNDDTNTP